MANPSRIPFLCAVLALSPLAARVAPQAPVDALAKAAEKGPLLEPGEGFAVGELDGRVQVFGEGRREGPMGSLSKLVWLQMEGSEWGSRLILFKCTGGSKDQPCGGPKGHGKVDVPKALQVDCTHAFQAWLQISAGVWKDIYGDGGARARLVEAFGPFLGRRLPMGNGLPVLDATWLGQGELLQASAEGFARWLVDPAQENLLDQARRNLNGFFNESPWWFQVGTAPVAGTAGLTRSWVVASEGKRVFVLSLPPGKSRAEALARMKGILGPTAK